MQPAHQLPVSETLESRMLLSAAQVPGAARAQRIEERAAVHAARVARREAKHEMKIAERLARAQRRAVADNSTVKTALPTYPAVLTEPSVAGANLHYQSFGDDSLFAATGPSENDIRQGDIDDCYLLATLAAVAKTDPTLIRNSITDLGNGTYEVAFHQNGQTINEVVDDQLPVDANGNLVYARLGQDNCIWVAIVEKAYCAFRTGADNSYAGIDSGWMDDAFTALECTPSDIRTGMYDTNLLEIIQNELAAGKAVTYATQQVADGAPLLADHAYSVDAVTADSSGNLTLTLRNPWGIAGAGPNADGTADVTITAQQAIDSLDGIAAASV